MPQRITSVSTASPQENVACTNIGPRERRKRVRFGIISLIAGIAFGLGLMFVGVDRGWRLALFVPFCAAGIGFFQAYEKT